MGRFVEILTGNRLKTLNRYFILLTSVVSMGMTNCQANDFIDKDRSQYIVNFDNDVLYGTDREYTAGSHWYYSKPEMAFNQWLFRPSLDFIFPRNTNVSTVDQFLLATEIYTLKAHEGNKVVNIANTGWTYFGFRSLKKSKRDQLGLELTIGWVGPGSGGEEIQNTIHELIGNKPETGWDHQYPDQPTLQIIASKQDSFFQTPDKEFEVFYTYGTTLGNIRTNVNAGLGASLAINSRPTFFDNHLNTIRFRSGWGYFFYSTISASYEIYNGLTDGRIFTNDPVRVRRESNIPWVDVGCGFTYDHFSINYSTKATTRYYKDQPESRFRYSSINFQWDY